MASDVSKTDTTETESGLDSGSLDFDVLQDALVWGYLTPNCFMFRSFRLVSDTVVFGKQGLAESIESDQFYALKEEEFPPSLFSLLSRLHFKIERVFDGEDYDVYITDLSSNGTFVDGEKLGKDCSRPLVSQNFISLANTTMIGGFVFEMSQEKGEQKFDEIPYEIRREFIVGKKLNSGASGFVHLAYRRDTFEKCALKFLSRSFSVYNEVTIMQKLRHPNIIKFQKYINTFKYHVIVMEYASGKDLFSYVNNEKTIPNEEEARFQFYQICIGVEYLHSKDVCHRDLKPENILLSRRSGRCLLKIADFGLSKVVEINGCLNEYVGSAHYVAPEVLRNKEDGSSSPYHLSADMWSMGCILYSLLCGTNAFSADNAEDLFMKIQSGNFRVDLLIDRGISPDAIDLLQNLLQVNPLGRYTISEALAHPWLTSRELRGDYEELFATMDPSRQPLKRRPPDFRRMSKSFKMLSISGIRRRRHSSSSDDQDCDGANVAKKRRD